MLQDKSQYLKRLERIEQEIDTMDKKEDEDKAKPTCSFTCKICQCLECAKIPGGDI